MSKNVDEKKPIETKLDVEIKQIKSRLNKLEEWMANDKRYHDFANWTC